MNEGEPAQRRTRQKRKRLIFALSWLLALTSGCGKSGETSTAAPRRAAVSGSGIIHGQVFFDAIAPQAKVVSPPDYWARAIDETVIVNSNGTLKNVLVYLKDAPPGDGGGPTVVLDQRNAQYIPRVLGLQVGQPLVIRNDDSHIHNVHLNCNINAQQNFGMMGVGDHEPITFKAPEFFQIKCDVHSWMDCEVGVFDHPYFAVTGDDGTFVINGVPPGSYTLVARHERYGEMPQSVTVTDKQTAEVTVRYKQP